MRKAVSSRSSRRLAGGEYKVEFCGDSIGVLVAVIAVATCDNEVVIECNKKSALLFLPGFPCRFLGPLSGFVVLAVPGLVGVDEDTPTDPTPLCAFI